MPEGLTGRSLTPFLEGQRPEGWRDAFYSQMNGVELYYTQRAVQTDDWKYVYNGFDFDELYDLPDDPHEMTNLAGQREYDEVKRTWCAGCGASPGRRTTTSSTATPRWPWPPGARGTPSSAAGDRPGWRYSTL